MSEGDFLLVLRDEELPVHPKDLAPKLAKLLRRVRYDVLNAMKLDPGIPFKDLSEQAAAEAVSVFEDAGARPAALPAEKLPADAKVFRVGKAVLEKEALSVQTDLAGSMRSLPWEGIAAVSAATISDISKPTGLSAVSVQDQIASAQALSNRLRGGMMLPRARRGKGVPEPKTRTDTYAVLCLTARDADFEMRVRSDAFNYGYLAERLTTSSWENFRLLAGDILKRAPAARVGRWARDLAESGARPPVIDAHMLERRNRWLKLLALEGL